jgi:hypothetical protein
MKRIILGFVLIISSFAFSQELKPVKIFHSIDEMTKEEQYYPSRRLVYADTITKGGETKVEAFGASLTLEKKKGVIYFDGISIRANDFGCSENSELIILFDNDENVKLYSSNKFNCDGKSWFELKKSSIEKLAMLNVKKIRITNGRDSSKSITGLIDEKDYFIKLIGLLQKNEITEK